jgi:hypothetical protein
MTISTDGQTYIYIVRFEFYAKLISYLLINTVEIVTVCVEILENLHK